MAQLLSTGMDHGTTNSTMAIMEAAGPRVIKHGKLGTYMPSAVFERDNGDLLIGQAAIEADIFGEAGKGCTAYKLDLGKTDKAIAFPRNRTRTPVQVATLVMQELLKMCGSQVGGGAAPRSCVITIPAMFEQAARDATRAAAHEAGLIYYPLIQEPRAAALAYGFARSDRNARWMVVDIGGGTTDVSLVMLNDGALDAPPEGHSGDRYLGGRKFDRDLMEHVLKILRKQYRLDSFTESSTRYQNAWARLRYAVEKAKIRLSSESSTHVRINPDDPSEVLCNDEAGHPVQVDVPITRWEYEGIIGRDIEKIIAICSEMLKQNSLAPGDIDRMVLIGGPSKTPAIRDALRSALKIDLATDKEIDPMTAVAIGAAVFTTVHEIPPEIERELRGSEDLPAGMLQLKLEYPGGATTETVPVNGLVSGSAMQRGLYVEISRDDGAWQSGRIPVDSNGMFRADVRLITTDHHVQASFTTQVFDARGNVLAQASEPVIWYGIGQIETRLPNSISAGVEFVRVEELLAQGVELPARVSGKVFRTLYDLNRPKGGQRKTVEFLEIPILEALPQILHGPDPFQNSKRKVGTLVIRGDDAKVSADLPAGTAIEVSLEIDTSTKIMVSAYVPLLDATFDVAFNSSTLDPSVDEIEGYLSGTNSRLARIRALQAAHPIAAVARALEDLERIGIVGDIARQLARAKAGEADARGRAGYSCLQVIGAMNVIDHLQREANIRRLFELLKPKFSGSQAQDLEDIEAEFQRAVAGNDQEQLSRINAALDKLDFDERRKPEFYLDWDFDAFAHHFGMAADGSFTVTGTQAQIDLWKELKAMQKELAETRAAGKEYSDEQMSRAKRVHEEMERSWPDLPNWRLDVPVPGSTKAG